MASTSHPVNMIKKAIQLGYDKTVIKVVQSLTDEAIATIIMEQWSGLVTLAIHHCVYKTLIHNIPNSIKEELGLKIKDEDEEEEKEKKKRGSQFYYDDKELGGFKMEHHNMQLVKSDRMVIP